MKKIKQNYETKLKYAYSNIYMYHGTGGIKTQSVIYCSTRHVYVYRTYKYICVNFVVHNGR